MLDLTTCVLNIIYMYNASFFKYYGVSKIFKETVLIVTCPIEYANKCTRLARSLGCTHTKCSMHRTEVREKPRNPKSFQTHNNIK